MSQRASQSAPPNRSRRAATGSSGWTVRCAQSILRLEAAASPDGAELSEGAAAHLDAARDALRRAQAALDNFTSASMPHRLLTSSATYVEVLASLQTATEQLLYVLSDEALLGLVPDLAGAVRNFLAADDPRRETYLTYLTNLQARVVRASVIEDAEALDVHTEDAPPTKSSASPDPRTA